MRFQHPIRHLYPELNLLSSEADRRAAFNRVQKEVVNPWATFGLLLLLLPGFIVFRLYALEPSLSPYLPRGALGWISGGVLGSIMAAVFHFRWHKPLQRGIRQYLVDRGIPVCLHCGYDLRGQTEPRCPECGRAFDSRLLKRPESRK